jgi:type VI secretion system VasD/TssJ family lipoprotein
MERVVIVLLLCILCGCSSPKVKVNVAADQALNQDNRQRSLPVVVRVYQLGSKTKFEQADFKQLWKQDETLLGNDVLSRDEYLVQPGQKNTFKLAKAKGAHYAVIMHNNIGVC